MKMKNLLIKNFRGFVDESFSLSNQFNVLVGANSTGKTAILEAACVGLSGYLASFGNLIPSRFIRNIRESDVRIGLSTTQDPDIVIPEGQPQYEVTIKCTAEINGESYTWERKKEKKEGHTKFGGKNSLRPLTSQWENKLIEDKASSIILPLVLYFSTSRLWSDSIRNETKFSKTPLRQEAYQDSLLPDRSLKQIMDYIENLSFRAANERGGKPFPTYEAIMRAIEQCVIMELDSGDSIDFSVQYRRLALKNKNSIYLPFSALSDGYRNIIGIVAEIATRMSILNPHLKDKAITETPGIVMIDELDLHLHPNWQKRVVDDLKRVFPKIQFICTTHSPFIIQSLSKGELIALDNDSALKYSGVSIEDIAEYVMNVEIPQWSEHKKKMYQDSVEFMAKLGHLKQDDILGRQTLRELLLLYSGRYVDDVAFLAFLQNKYDTKMIELEKKSETC